MSDTEDTPSKQYGHVDVVNLTVSLCLCYTLCIALVRLWIRRGAFGVDDLVVLFATLVTLGHTGSSYAALAKGLGKPWNDIADDPELNDLDAVCVDYYYCSEHTDSVDRHHLRALSRLSSPYTSRRSGFLLS